MNPPTHSKTGPASDWLAFIENSTDAFIEGEVSGKILFVNDAACRLFGYDRASLLGMRVDDLLAYDEDQRRARRRELLEKKHTVNPAVKYLPRNREIRIANVTTQLSRGQDGSYTNFQAIVHDVTEQHRTLETLKQRNEELAALNAVAQILSNPLELSAALAQVCAQIISITGMESAAIYIADESRRFLELIAQYGVSESLIAAMGRPGLDDPVTRSIAEGVTLALDDVMTYPGDGLAGPRSEGYHAVIMVPILMGETSVGILGAGSKVKMQYDKADIALLLNIGRQIGKALENARLFQNVVSEQRKIQAIFDSGLSGLYATDASGRIVMFNRAAERTTDWTLAQVQGKRWQDVFANLPDHSPSESLIDFALEHKMPRYVHDERWLRTHDGRVIPVAEAVAPLLDEQGHVTGAVGAFFDLSREQAAEIEREEFLREVAHQLRSPLTAVLSAAQLLERPNLSEARRAEMWNILKSDGQRLKRFADQFLDLEAVIKSQRPLRLERLPIAQVTRAVVNQFRNHQCQHRFHVRVAPRNLFALADLARVENILRNLLDNAISYSPPDSLITVSVKPSQNRDIQFSVKDQGPGVPAAEREKIFETFFRSAQLQDRHIYGHGLGLAIAKRCVSEMGGTIWLDCLATRGATFHFTLRRYR